MRKLLFSLLLILSSISWLYGQSSSKRSESKKFILNDVSFIFGEPFFFSESESLPLEGLRKISANSPILPTSFVGFENDEINLYRRQFTIAMLAGFDLVNKSESKLFKHTTLRIGLLYNNQNFLGADYTKRSRFATDTLIILGTNEKIPLDSITEANYTTNFDSRQLGLDVSLILKSNPDKLVSVYGGLGFSVARSFYSITDIGYRYHGIKGIQSEQVQDFKLYGFSSDPTFAFEEIEDLSSTSFAVYAPIGINFKFSKKDDLLGKLSLFYELRAGLSTTLISDYGSVSGAVLSNCGGLRINLY